MTSDKGFDQKKPLYQICAWNCLKEENSWRDRENNLIKSIRTYLEEKQFQSVLNEEDEPDLIVLLPDKNERLLNNNDFRVFRHGWGNKTKKILYIHFTLGQRFCRDIFLSLGHTRYLDQISPNPVLMIGYLGMAKHTKIDQLKKVVLQRKIKILLNRVSFI